MCTSCCLQNAGIGMLRSKIRGAYQIEGSVCEDCICGACCPCCTACQIYRKLLT